MQNDPAGLLAGLLAATASRDQVAFAELYRLTSGRLHAAALRIARSADLAQEGLQEAYVRIWTEAARFDPARGHPLAWMYVILRHACIDARRWHGRHPPTDGLDGVEIALPPHTPDALDLARCVGTLGAAEARAIRLAFDYGLSHVELARTLDQPLGTVKSLVRRSLLKLRACLGAGDRVGQVPAEGAPP